MALLGVTTIAVFLVAGTATAYAHGGRTNSQGCHKNSKTGKPIATAKSPSPVMTEWVRCGNNESWEMGVRRYPAFHPLKSPIKLAF